MSYFFKHILPWQVVLTVIYLIYMFMNNNIYQFLLAAIPAIFLIFKIYYDKSKYMFILCRKIYAWWKNPGMHWSCSYVYILDDQIDFRKISKKYIDKLRAEMYDVKEIEDYADKLSFLINDSRLNIYYEIGAQEIKVEYSSNISYKESIKVFKDDFLIYKQILENLTANTNENLYSLKLKFNKYNPFYSLYIKNYADIEINQFHLNYATKNLTIEISEKVMVIHSHNEKSITEALENYLIVSE